jgi:DNA-binding transcriptional ArsR family regulator
MKRVHSIEDLSALRAMTDPLRKQILRELQPEPRTTARLAAILGEKPTKLHYHVHELERHGLIELVETRMKGNLQEKYYRAAAEYYRVDPRLFQEGPESQEAFFDHAAGLLDRTALDLRAAIRDGQITPEESAKSLATLLCLHLSPEDAASFRSRLEGLVAEYRERSDPSEAGAVLLSLMFIPLAPAGAPTTDREANG